ncbi:uncharacterized protein LOC123515415 isoform X2 [Portunus trituberculatus]|uniref:uncharacterized protein LOC123515415 isoform X2 n=1 Tax=Portunus trituberculatus TaxID=210409 RepID=UPI001E1D01DC|nr:uncharacterized protein LOC123515415 isoform X2 [Portunus trituberculatus]
MAGLELKERLHGTEPLCVRLSLAEKAFLAPLKAAVAQKEDVVILWLANLLTKKAVALTTEEQLAAWTTLSTILSSQRLKALCSINWVCPITSSFTETLVDVINSSADTALREKAVMICHCLMSNPLLAPLVTHSLNHCLLLSKGLVAWLLEGHMGDANVAVAAMLIGEVGSRLQSHADKGKVMTSVTEHLLLPSARLAVSARDDERKEMQDLLKEMKLLIATSLFHTELLDNYKNAFMIIFSETKARVTHKIISLLQVIASYIESEPIEVMQHLLAETLYEFMMKFRTYKTLHCQLLVVLCHALGITINNPKVPSLVQDTFISQKLRPSVIDERKKEVLLHSLLCVIQNIPIHFVRDGDIDLLLKGVGEILVNAVPVSSAGYKCLQVLLAIVPTFMSNLIVQNVWDIYCCKSPDNTASVGELYSSYEELLCKVLEVCVRLRNLPRMFEKMFSALKTKSEQLKDQEIIPESLHAHQERLIFPPRFIALLRRTLLDLSHLQVLPVWTSILSFLTKESTVLLKTAAKPGELELVSLVVWVLAVVVEASPSLQMATLAGDATRLADIMTQIAVAGIKPLVTVMLTQPHNNNVCASVLVMCHTWGELHISLLTTDVGYRDCPTLPKVSPFNPSPPTDLSHLFPFIPSDAWAQISARVANFGNKAARLALMQLVIQKFSQASLEQHKGAFSQDTAMEAMEDTGQAVTQTTMDTASKYLTNALDSWGSSVSCLFTVHLTYLVPFLNTTQLTVVSRHLVNGIREGDKAWSEYVSSRHFEEANQLHPMVFSDICASLATMFDSNKRKLSECEDGPPQPTKSHCLKILKKMSKVGPLLVEFEPVQKKDDALWKLFEECGECLRKLIEKEQRQSSSVQKCTMAEFKVLIQLIRKFPLKHLNVNMKTSVLLVLFSLMIQESSEGREEVFFDIVLTLNLTLGYVGSFRLFTITKASSVMQWLIEKRVSLYGSMLSQHMANLPHVVLKGNNTYVAKFMDRQYLSPDLQNCYNFDNLLLYLTYKLTSIVSLSDQVKEVAEYITSSSTNTIESMLQPAVFLLAPCHMKGTAYCNWAKQHLTTWILRYVKKMDLDTTCPATAATVLTAHTIMVQAGAPSLTEAQSKEEAKSLEGIATESSEAKKEGTKENAMSKEDTKKSMKWKKLLGRSVQLSELCLSSGNKELEEYALAFLLTVAQHSDVLNAYLPPQLLTIAWSALSLPDRCPSGVDADVYAKVCLEPVLLTASPEEYNKLLEDLLLRTHKDHVQLSHTLRLWRLVINSTVTTVNGYLKRISLEYLIPILVHLATSHLTTAPSDCSLLHDVLLTLQEIIQTSFSVDDQTKAHLLMPCTTIQLHQLPHHNFCQIFNTAANIVNSVVVNHSNMVVDRTPTVLAAIAHLTTALITQASQEHKLEDQQIKELVECSSNIERLVKQLAAFEEKLNKVVHFTMATIVIALQRTTVYPAVKMVIESIVYRLLDLCDSHCLQHLLVALPPATTTLLKHLHDNYVTFHRYNPGKV